MKAVNSSSSLLNIMIPQFQQLLPLETSVSGSCLNNHYSSELLSTTNKLLSPPISMTPSSICTDLSENEFQPVDLSLSNKYSLSSPPLSNSKNESMDLTDCISSYSKQDSSMTITNYKKNSFSKSKSTFRTNKQQCSNFTIEHLLSSSHQSPTYEFLTLSYKQINSIFTKKKPKNFSDNYLHQIIHYKKQFKQKEKNISITKYSNQSQGKFIGYIFTLYNDLINQQNQIKNHENFFTNDALEQLAEIACKMDTRQNKTLLLNENKFKLEDYNLLIKQSYLLIKQIYQKNQHKKYRKRLNFNLKLNIKKRFLHFLLSILNILEKEKYYLLYGSNHFNCHILMSDIKKIQLKTKLNEKFLTTTICSYLKSDQMISNNEILIPNNGLLYEGIIQLIDNYDDLLLVRLNHERQTYLIPIHDLCRLACPKIIPTDFNMLSKGSRVCAFWSTSLRGLHPAKVKKLPSEDDESSMISLLFDDGDTGLIKLDEIRLLPDDYNDKGVNLEEWRVSSSQIPLIASTKRRISRRVSSTTSVKTNSTSENFKKGKTSTSSSTLKVPRWILNTRDSTICRHDNKRIKLHVGDCVVLHGIDQSLSYIGKVLKFYHNKSTQKDMVRLKWFYSPQETTLGLHKNDLPGALYESTHADENLIATIRYKGTIYGSYDEYVKKTDYGNKRKITDFYLVGHYNPTSGEIRRYDDK